MGIVITVMILAVGGFFLWTKVIQPQMSGKYAGLATEAEKEYAEKGEEMKKEAFENPDKFGIFKQVIPEDEKIVAIASHAEPKSIGKNLLGGAATMVTRVKKVNMCHFYLIVTDKNLHSVAFNGENSVSHDMFDLEEIKEVKTGKTGAAKSMLKDSLSGVEGNFDKLYFTYKDKKYEYNIDKFVAGYPIFEVKKDSMSESFYRIYKAHGESNDVYDYKNIAFYLENKLRTDLYNDFKKVVGQRYNVEFPAY